MTVETKVGPWKVAVASACELAERPVWDVSESALFWVDVLGGVLHRSHAPLDAGNGWRDSAAKIGQTVGAVVLRADGGLVAAADRGFVMLDQQGRIDADLIPVDMPPDQRFNDAVCDPAGRLLAGTTSCTSSPDQGLLWSLDASGIVTTLLESVTESNGLGWSLDGRTMYYVDSGEPVIRRYRYDAEHGRLGDRLTDLTGFDSHNGVPDGLVVDSDGAVWVAMWQGSAVRRYSPDGQLLAHVDTPVDRPTCPGFAGPGLDLLVLTTAWEAMTPEERIAWPWSGHLLSAPVSVSGQLPHRYRRNPQ